MITVIDYGLGNLNSVYKALIYANNSSGLKEKIIITRSKEKINKAKAIILPGVGAVDNAIHNLRKFKIENIIKKKIESGTLFLGICLGFQMLFEKSFENGIHDGLGILKGNVKKFDLPKSYKIPHMGWNTVSAPKCPILKNISDESYFYFVHSYYVEVKDKNIGIMYTNYGKKFASGIFKDNIYGVQFHPEKSQKAGLKLLENFCKTIKLSSRTNKNFF
jgi:imidazole glycerol-phosphate synthase subunit HisH